MLSSSVFAACGLMIAIGLLGPTALAVFWLLKKKERVSTVLVGAATWFVFAIVLESIPKAILFNPANSIGKTVTESVALYSILGALTAGIFEETGRLLAFRFVLKKRTNKETGMSHGIGHGGFEAAFILVLTGFQNISYAVIINAGQLQEIIDEVANAGMDTSAIEALPEQLAALTPAYALMSAGERIFAILLHIALSIMVFYGVRKKKIIFYIFAILLHALYDLPAALYQTGTIDIYVTEVILAVFAVISFGAVYKLLYCRYEESEESTVKTV